MRRTGEAVPTKSSRRSRGTATILDVASVAGVSSMTVSRVVNGAPHVRDSTRRRVLEAIEQLNYSPNTAARSLAAGAATTIGTFYAHPSDAYLTQFLVGALHGARRSEERRGGHKGGRTCRSRWAPST